MVVLNHCQSSFCKNGGYCPGCNKDGTLNCGDPECAPYCRGCELPRNHDSSANLVFGIIFTLLFIIAFSLLIVLGPRFVIFHDGDRNKPRKPDYWLLD